jgi:hypothetical protein
VYKPNSAVEAFRSLLETLLSVYVKDRYATGLVDVFAVSLPRLQRPVEEEVLEKAKDVADGVHPSQGTEEVASGGEEQREGQESGEAEEVKDEDIKLQEDEGKDNVMEDAHDDPVTTVEAMEEVEESAKEPAPISPPSVEEDDAETDGETKLVVHIVANIYKLSNFWSVSFTTSQHTLEVLREEEPLTHSRTKSTGQGDGGRLTHSPPLPQPKLTALSKFKSTTLKKETCN